MYAANITKIYKFIKFGSVLSTVWPSNESKSEFKRIIYELASWIYILALFASWGPCGYSIFHYRHDFSMVLTVGMQWAIMTEVVFNIFLCKLQKTRLKVVLKEATLFIQNANEEGMSMIQKYVNRHVYLFSGVTSSFAMADFVFCITPLVTQREFPGDIWYPFALEPRIVHYTIYFLQIIAANQAALGLFTDFMIAFLICMCSARLELLGLECTRVNSDRDVCHCIRKHQHLILFISEINTAIRYVIAKSYGMMMLTLICGGCQLLNNEPLSATSRFILILIATILRLYMIAKPADDLKNVSTSITSSIFQSPWPDLSQLAKRNLLITMLRSEKPFVISVSGFMDELSLGHFAAFLSSTLKIFMNVRVVYEK